MCKYCSELFTGDCNNSLLTTNIKAFGMDLLSVDVFITDNILELYIDNIDGDKIEKKTIKINYCPNCGARMVEPIGK